MSAKARRHAAILRIVRRDAVESQERLRERLREAGFAVTQATLSRDLREIGLSKVATPDGGARYAAPPGGSAAVRSSLEHVVPALLVSADGAGSLLVLRTTAIRGSIVAAVVLDRLLSYYLVVGIGALILIGMSRITRRQTVAGQSDG